jgi:hypothetical protein
MICGACAGQLAAAAIAAAGIVRGNVWAIAAARSKLELGSGNDVQHRFCRGFQASQAPHGRAAMVEPLGASGLVVAAEAAAAWPPWAGGAGERRLKESRKLKRGRELFWEMHAFGAMPLSRIHRNAKLPNALPSPCDLPPAVGPWLPTSLQQSNILGKFDRPELLPRAFGDEP